ncbi:MAG TPA: 30S ribosomal protein S8 [Candidatus Babeliales bacterium]|nr:30S ribosomal protein S8 [Candidatus Babeliales bacterium]
MSVDAVGNFLTIIRNGLLSSKPFVITQYSVMNSSIASILKDEGFIRDSAVVEEDGGKKFLKITLKYVNGESVIHEIRRVSTPGRRYYAGAAELKPVIGGLGISILTTNRGVFTNKKAKELSVGGEVLCTIW